MTEVKTDEQRAREFINLITGAWPTPAELRLTLAMLAEVRAERDAELAIDRRIEMAREHAVAIRDACKGEVNDPEELLGIAESLVGLLESLKKKALQAAPSGETKALPDSSFCFCSDYQSSGLPCLPGKCPNNPANKRPTACLCTGRPWDPLNPFAHRDDCPLAGGECRGCRKPLLKANRWMADGCPCNAPRGVNHGIVPENVCTCEACDPAQTGSSRFSIPPSVATARKDR